MNKGLFKGNIKHECVSFIWTTILLVVFIFLSVGSLLLYSAFQHEPDSLDRIGFLAFSILFYLFGILYLFFTIFVIRKYPEYPKLRGLCLNSDYYFVGSDSKEFHGHRRGRGTFHMLRQVASQNEGLENIKYPRQYKIYIALTVVGIVLMFEYLAVALIILDNIDVLPKAIQNESIIFAILVVIEAIDLILSFLFAFRVKNIRKAAIDEFRKIQMK